MHVTEIGYGALFVGSQYTLIRDLFTLSWALSYLVCVLLFCILGQRPHGGVSKERWFYATVFTPMYFAVLLFIPALARPLTCLTVATVGVLVKIGICMSVCLHRYAAHQAFHCGPLTAFVVHWIGCLANQGGPLWWAANHRCHHKFCDAETLGSRDPHSPLLDGPTNAYAFLVEHGSLKEEFAPRHCDSLATRLLDTWCFVPNLIEYTLSLRHDVLVELVETDLEVGVVQTRTISAGKARRNSSIRAGRPGEAESPESDGHRPGPGSIG